VLLRLAGFSFLEKAATPGAADTVIGHGSAVESKEAEDFHFRSWYLASCQLSPKWRMDLIHFLW
jgi:hypothetical protein